MTDAAPPTRPPAGPAAPAKRLLGLKRALTRTMVADRQALEKEIARLQAALRPGGRAPDAARLDRLAQRLRVSADRRRRRAAQAPAWQPLAALPISACQADIVAAIRRHPVVIVAGETGSGKTTQLPKFCLAAGRGAAGLIGCTQPRRIAAVTVAQRIAEELGEPLGQSVGYKIRFQDRTHRNGYIKIMTDGILLAETQRDPWLGAYDTLIVDEAHERSLNIDFVLGLLKQLVRRRRDLKLIITSATIDTEKFAAAFDGAPVIEVSGRMYPVAMRYTPLSASDAAGEEETHVEAAVRAVAALDGEGGRGDVLVFMPTEQDIRETCDLLEARQLPKTVVLPLYARLAAADQQRVFSATGARKIVVATNVAETSITIPGIRYVVDTGLARILRYSPRTRTTALPVVPIARSSADQRAGRCGRVADGVCIRLFSEADYQGRPRFTPPEILRANLADVILRMIALDLGDVRTFPFIDPPDPRSINDGLNLLDELGAIEAQPHPAGDKRQNGGHRLTARGRIMAQMPVDPRLSRMLIEAARQGCLTEILVLAAALSIQDPRERPADRTQAADQAHAVFKDPASDCVTLLNIWEKAREAYRRQGALGGLKRFCRQHFLSFRRMREWWDIQQQLTIVAAEAGLSQAATSNGASPPAAAVPKDAEFGARYTAIHQAVLSGFLSNIAQKKEKNIYRAARGRECMLFPGSGLFNRGGEWIVAAEMVHTSRLFARTVAKIDCAWLEALAGPQCRAAYLEPHWERRRGEVVAYEQVSLYGLVIVARRPVSFSRIDPEGAAELFVRSALIAGDVRPPLPFMAHNAAVMARIEDMENRLRRRDLLVDAETLYRFYRERLDLTADIRTLKRLIRTRGGDGFLRIAEADLLRQRPDEDELARFPDRLQLGRTRLEARYRFNPGQEDDGVTVRVPAAEAHQVSAAAADWLVPGLLPEKILALLKALPKEYRRRLVPLNEAAARIAAELPRAEKPLLTELGAFIQANFGVDIPAAAWATDDLPAHLRLRFTLTDPKGRILAAARDAAVLGTAPPAPRADWVDAARRRWEREDLRSWDFGDLPERVPAGQGAEDAIVLFPALVAPKEESGGIALRLFATFAEAQQMHVAGVAALLEIALAGELRHLKRQLRLPPETARRVRFPGGAGGIENQLYTRVVRDLLQRNIRRAADLDAHAAQVRPRILAAGRDLRQAVLPVLLALDELETLYAALARETGGHGPGAEFVQQQREALPRLVPPHFVELYDAVRMPHLVRYLQAAGLRARRAVQDLARDRLKAAEVIPFEEALQGLVTGLPPQASAHKRAALEDLFWMIEEFKVSCFAQELKTAGPVSAKRLRKRIAEIRRMV